MLHRLGWALTGAMALIAVFALARALEAGPLDPPGPVGSTMRTLDELAPSWDRKLTAVSADPCHSERFECVLPDLTYADGAAVLDHETGLVWQRAPATTLQNWVDVMMSCGSSNTGGRWGWRTPTIDELTSLLLWDDPGPFDLGVGSTQYWSSTVLRDPGDSSAYPWVADFYRTGSAFTGVAAAEHRAWCVRGGPGGGER